MSQVEPADAEIRHDHAFREGWTRQPTHHDPKAVIAQEDVTDTGDQHRHEIGSTSSAPKKTDAPAGASPRRATLDRFVPGQAALVADRDFVATGKATPGSNFIHDW
jgi:hypothetical protein